ncbi:hypothetical protein [Phenylobacterium sp.]|uniref:hypothetical protein n=1 Tax=Phenylobacterium sp. TaxID=1871053 RepID=UPI003982EC6F
MRTQFNVIAAAAAAALVLVLALSAPAALAADGKGVAAAFGNTVRSLYPDGRQQRLWLKPDGSWDAIGRRGKPSSGKWTQKGEKVCLKQVKPFAAPMSYCTDFPTDGALGAQWLSKDITGVPINITLIKGIQKP